MSTDLQTAPARPATLPKLVIFISTAAANHARRKAIRNSWFRYLRDASGPLIDAAKASTQTFFIAARGAGELEAEQETHGDILLLDAPEGYAHLWRKALTFLAWLEDRAKSGARYDYVMHADDDSFVRLDLLLPLMGGWPAERFYLGYIWDGTGNRCTAPIRNPRNKSYMPESQYPPDTYPPFASGCGFVLSRDLAQALLSKPLPDYRLLDPPFGIHLCGDPALCVAPGGPVVPVHDERIRPYRPIPTFRPDTLVQHYLAPEEMKPYYDQALHAAHHQHQQPDRQDAQGEAREASSSNAGAVGPAAAPAAASPATELYDTLVALGLLRR